MWGQEKSQSLHDQGLSLYSAILSEAVGKMIFRCVSHNKHTKISLFVEKHSLLYYREWFKAN